MRDALALSPTALRRWGDGLLVAALGLGLCITARIAWSAPGLLPVLPLGLIAAGALLLLFRHPRVSFVVWMMGFPFLLSSEPGLQVQEVLYGLYFFAFLAHWYGRRLLLYRSRMIRGLEDRVVALWLGFGLPAGLFLAVLFGAPPGAIRGEVLAFLMLALYFPVKEFVVRERQGPLIVFLLLAWMGVMITVENAFDAQRRFADATQVWEIANVRTGGRELFLTFPGLLVMAVLAGVRRRRIAPVLLVVFAALFAGLILTKSRAFWVAFAMGTVALVLLLRGPRRRQLLLFFGAGLLVLGVLSLFVAGSYLNLLLLGIQNRLLTLGSTSTDVSLINRFVESAAVRERIWQNPVLGYGFGTPYTYFRLIEHATLTYSYVHNGYLAVWYKLGLWGVALVGTAWVRAGWCAFRAGRSRTLPIFERVLGLGVVACLLALLLPAYTTNVFFEDEKLAAFTLVAALGCGLYQRRGGRPPETAASPAAFGEEG